MNLDFSDDQKFLQDEARKFFDKEGGLTNTRKVMDESLSHDQALWGKVLELGWTGIRIPEEYDGLGLGHLELCVIAEEIGRALAPIPFSSSVYLFTETIIKYGSEEIKKNVLPKLVTGEIVGTYAVAEDMSAIRGQKLDPDTGTDQPIQAYIDEMPVRPQVAFYQMFDTERVEILKGAQGTLQGVVSTGGALQIYTRDAEIGSDARNGYIKTSFADNSTQILEFASDIGISDTMAMRFAAVTNDNAGNEVKNIRNNQREDHAYDAFRLSLNWEPSDNLSLRLKYQNMESTSIAPRSNTG